MIYSLFRFSHQSLLSLLTTSTNLLLYNTPSYHEERYKSEQNGVRRQRSSFFLFFIGGNTLGIRCFILSILIFTYLVVSLSIAS